jgi:release factor glutamine methyltransferase
MTIDEALKQAAELLKTAAIQEPRREAASLLELAGGYEKTFVFAHPEHRLTQDEENLFTSYINRRAAREPLQYIRGHQEFYGLDFEVTPDVLIPRPETELLVENAINELRTVKNPSFCEVGVGSGCISVSILHEIPSAASTALDISDAALMIARKNAERHRVSPRLSLLRSDVFNALTEEQFDMIVSNPPYVPKGDFESLQPEVRDFEPRVALTDGGGGLSIIERIVSQSPQFLRPGGTLLMEIGFGQVESVLNMFSEQVWQDLEALDDLQCIPRIVRARISRKL